MLGSLRRLILKKFYRMRFTLAFAIRSVDSIQSLDLRLQGVVSHAGQDAPPTRRGVARGARCPPTRRGVALLYNITAAIEFGSAM